MPMNGNFPTGAQIFLWRKVLTILRDDKNKNNQDSLNDFIMLLLHDCSTSAKWITLVGAKI